MRVLAALSGGVDSSVAAALALRDGCDVVGITMLLYGGEKQGRSCSTSDESAAAQAAGVLGVEHVVVDHTEQFARVVMGEFAAGAAAGATPNPCITCNRTFKLDWLFAFAVEHGFDCVVTGHHARVVRHRGESWLARSVNDAKDQSYVLYTASAAQLAMLRLPLGGFASKEEVRAIAAQLSLPAAGSAESMELCFSRAATLPSLTEASVVDADGRVVGVTPAAELLTVGQRRGVCAEMPPGQFVAESRPGEQRVFLGRADDLLCDHLRLSDVVLPHGPVQSVFVQLSAHGRLVAGELDGDVVRFPGRQRRPGRQQHAVLYVDSDQGLLVAGGGTIA